MRRPIVYLALVSASLCASAGSAVAGTIHSLDAGPMWRATSDPVLGEQWLNLNFDPRDGVAAFSPYGNNATTSIDPDKMMWYCEGDAPTCTQQAQSGRGNVAAYFAREIFIDENETVISGGFGIIADDYVELWGRNGLYFNAVLEAVVSGRWRARRA